MGRLNRLGLESGNSYIRSSGRAAEGDGLENRFIGEAAAKISKEKREQSAQIPWRAIIGMRNHLIHAYDEIDVDILWDTITNDIPQLIAELEVV